MRTILLAALLCGSSGCALPLFAQDSWQTASVPERTSLSGAGHSFSPVYSADGRFLAFVSQANNLVTNDSPTPFLDLFLRDLAAGLTHLVSVDVSGTGGGHGNSEFPSVSSNGQHVAFAGAASNLVADDYNDAGDIFLLHLGAGDSDGDGLDDGWEETYFSGLDRDGQEDFDQDGHTDQEEFLAGTDPTNRGSIFQILRLTRQGTDQALLLWSAEPGKTYRVQFKLGMPNWSWVDLGGRVTATGTTVSMVDPSTPFAQKHCRVVLDQGSATTR